MIGQLRAAGLFVPLVLVIASVAALIALGNWQWQRMQWKAGLLKQLEAAGSAAPVVLKRVPGQQATVEELNALRYRRVTVQGRFENDREMHVWAPGVKAAWSVVTPLRLTQITGQSGSTAAGTAKDQASHIFVVRGVVPDARKAATSRRDGQLSGDVRVTGRIRLDRPNTWANAPNVAKNQWYTRDLKVMTQHQAGMSASADKAFAPFFLEAVDQMGGPLAPKPDLRALKLANKHLEYALTWWGLAGTLLVVFTIFAWGRINGDSHQGGRTRKQV